MVSRTFLSAGRAPNGRTMAMIRTFEDTVPSMRRDDTPISDVPHIYRTRPPAIPENYVCSSCRSFLGGKCFGNSMERVRPDYGCASFRARANA